MVSAFNRTAPMGAEDSLLLPKTVATRLKAATTAQELDSIVEQVEAERRRAAANLVGLLREDRSSMIKARACYLLGVLGDLADADALIENIEVGYDLSVMERHMIGLLGPFPCAEALFSFGNPIRERVVRLIATTDGDCKQDLGVFVLSGSARGDFTPAKEVDDEVRRILRDGISKDADDSAKRLQRALDRVGTRSWPPFRCHYAEPEADERHVDRSPSQPVDFESIADRLRATKSRGERDGILREVVAERHYLLTTLDALLRGPSATAVKARACFLLGQFHVWPVDDQLIEHVDLEWVGGRQRYPCEVALIKSGKAGDRRVVSDLARDDDPVKREHLVGVMISWYGGARVVARLKEAMSKEEGAGAKRLAEALKLAEAQAEKHGD
jgi:hypothetical protein